MLFEALVTAVLPKVGGIRVRFRDLVPSGYGANDYVRVLCRRMSPQGGATLDLPEVGEHGVVGQMAGGTCVWLGASPFLDQNQVDPTPGIAYSRHRSGVVSQVRDTGEFEIAHPSGLRVTASIPGGALPALQATSQPLDTGGEVPTLEIVHPSGGSLVLGQDGSVTVNGALINLQGTVATSRTGLGTAPGAGTVFVAAPSVTAKTQIFVTPSGMPAGYSLVACYVVSSAPGSGFTVATNGPMTFSWLLVETE